ncbi:MAG TPA: NADH:ubiquinone reductase (Na(+)-transporting) subunit A, partial [Longimicrobiales bacterium]|nr:NADH:ubiquinone reductase (Na(+)-transporting) subunit A [Longimicrobiales bacterium]
SGLWTAFRTRPFSKVPAPTSVPSGIFVTAMDTNPLAPDPDVVLAEARAEFELGLRAIAKLSGEETFVCVRGGSDLARGLEAPVRVEEFTGPHPAGTAGYHIHALLPVGRARTVWTIGYQDVVSVGRLLSEGRLDVSRIVAIGGPPVSGPRLVRTRLGASVADLTGAEKVEGPVRWISGSVLSGKAAVGEAFGYMGRYDVQLSALGEGGERELLAWLAPGTRKFSVLPVFASRFTGRKPLEMSTDAHGSRRAIIPIGAYERVMPIDILPTFLLRALAVGDVERAEELGCLELDEEDLALCSFVDPGKSDFGPMLRRVLEVIAGEG